MLNRQKWDAARFHKMMISLLSVGPGARVLDLGCGRGSSLGPLLEGVGGTGGVFGLDRSDQAFTEARARHPWAVKSGRLVLVLSEVLNAPFVDSTFDAVLCQNVAECVNDRAALVAEAHRILKSGGRLLLGHHDFDGVLITSNDRELTRRLVHGFADHKQDWQDSAEGRMGRMISGLVANAGFLSVEVETAMFVDLDLEDGSYARDYVSWLADLAPAIGVEPAQAANWRASLGKAAAEGQFFFGLPWVAAICRKA